MSHSVAFDISGSIVRAAISVRHTLDGVTTAERVLIDFLKKTPLLSAPWTFDEVQKKRQIYCFLFEFDEVRDVLRKGIRYTDHYATLTNQKFVTRILTMGSQAHVFEEQLTQLLAAHNATERAPKGLPPLEAVIVKRKELHCVRDALHYFNQNLASSLYQYKRTTKFVTDAAKSPVDTEYVTTSEDNGFPLYPYLLVNFKAGISFHLVTEDGSIKRLGGSPIGLATFLGLSQLFCGDEATAYETFLRSDEGEQTRVDMLVADIYGGDYSSVGLKGSMVASTMGKLQHIRARNPPVSLSPPGSAEDSPIAIPVRPFPSFTLEADGSPRSISHSASFDAGVQLNSNELTQCPTKSASIPIKSGLQKSRPFRPLGKETEIEGLTVVRILESDVQMTYTFSDRLTNENEALEENLTANAAEQVEDTICELDHVVYKEDIYKSLLSMTTFNVAQLAYFNAVMSNCDRIVFIGYYVDMPETLAAVQHCIQFWSEGRTKVNFVRVAPYLGAIGAALAEALRCSN